MSLGTLEDLAFEFDELELDDLSVTSIRDAAALPETGASSGSSSSSASSCCGSSSCCSSCTLDPEVPA